MVLSNAYHPIYQKNRILNYSRALMRLTLKYIQKDYIFDNNVKIYAYYLNCQLIKNRPKQLHVKNICIFTGRSRGVYRRFKLARSQIKLYSNLSLLPGVVKTSW